jgi:hypothetical protein
VCSPETIDFCTNWLPITSEFTDPSNFVTTSWTVTGSDVASTGS